MTTQQTILNNLQIAANIGLETLPMMPHQIPTSV